MSTALSWHVVGFGALVVWALSEQTTTPTSTSSPGRNIEQIGYLAIYVAIAAAMAGAAAGIGALVLALLIRRATPVQGNVPPATSTRRMVALSSWAAFGAGTAGVLIWWSIVIGGLYVLSSLLGALMA